MHAVMMEPDTDRSLAREFRAGRREALADLVERYADAAFRAALALLYEPNDAEEAVQTVVVALVGAPERFLSADNFKAYFLQSVRHQAMKMLRQRKARPSVPAESLAHLYAPADETVDTEQVAAIEEALRVLPPEQREVVVLHIYQELQFTEIAEITGENYKTVTSRYRYALEKIRERLAP